MLSKSTSESDNSARSSGGRGAVIAALNPGIGAVIAALSWSIDRSTTVSGSEPGGRGAGSGGEEPGDATRPAGLTGGVSLVAVCRATSFAGADEINSNVLFDNTEDSCNR